MFSFCQIGKSAVYPRVEENTPEAMRNGMRNGMRN